MPIDIENPGAHQAALSAALKTLIGIPFRGARVRMNADDTGQNITSGANVTFDVEDFDTDGFFDGGAPTRLTIPAGLGITHVELVGQVYISSSTGDTTFNVTIRHNNSAGTPLRVIGSRFVEGGGALKQLNMSTGPLAVSDGDYFELRPAEESDNSITIEGDDVAETYMSLRVVGLTPP